MTWDMEIKSGDTLPYQFDLSDATGTLDLTNNWDVFVTIADALDGTVVVDDEQVTVVDADTVMYTPLEQGVLEVGDDGRMRDLFAEFRLQDANIAERVARVPTHGYLVIHVNPQVPVTVEP